MLLKVSFLEYQLLISLGGQVCELGVHILIQKLV